MDTTEIITAIDQYNATPREVVSANIHRLMSLYKARYIADRMGVATQTVYGWTKRKYNNKPPFDMALKFVATIGVDIGELSKPVELSEEGEDFKRCAVEGCDDPVAAKDLCDKHYQQLRRLKKKVERR